MKKILLLFGHLFLYFRICSIISYIQRIIDIIYTGYQSKKFVFYGGGKIEFPAEQIIGHQYISIGRNTLLSKHIILTAFDKRKTQTFYPKIIIGRNCIIGEYMHITAVGRIIIGDNVLTGRYCLISDNSHGKTVREELLKSPIERPLIHDDVIIGNNVWLGDSVCILRGVHIGDGCVIGAGSIVTKSIPDYCVAAGNPAKVIKQL